MLSSNLPIILKSKEPHAENKGQSESIDVTYYDSRHECRLKDTHVKVEIEPDFIKKEMEIESPNYFILND